MSNYYALNIAVESQQKSLKELNGLFKKVIENRAEELSALGRILNFFKQFSKIIFFWRCNCPCEESNE